jgi:hypothetical protein
LPTGASSRRGRFDDDVLDGAIVGGRRGNTGQYQIGQLLFDLSQSEDKDFFVVGEAGHYDLYNKPEYVDQAIDRLVSSYLRHLCA